MERDEILQKISQVRSGLARDQYRIMKGMILERRFHLHRSKRIPILRKIIEKLRGKLVREVELALGPVLDKQRDIDLRFLEEIERLKKACQADGADGALQRDETGNPHPPDESQR